MKSLCDISTLNFCTYEYHFRYLSCPIFANVKHASFLCIIGHSCQEIHPFSASNIDSVEINTSLLVMKVCIRTLPRRDVLSPNTVKGCIEKDIPHPDSVQRDTIFKAASQKSKILNSFCSQKSFPLFKYFHLPAAENMNLKTF